MSKYIKSVSGYNFAGFSSIQVNFDRDVNYVIGMNGHGKTKLGLDLIWFILQGIAEKSKGGNVPLVADRFRFIGKNGPTALGELVIHDDIIKKDIRIIRKLTKSGTEVSFSAPPGVVLTQEWLNDMFNLFLISPKKFIELHPREQALAIGIDTSKWDGELEELNDQRKKLEKEVAAFDNLEVVLRVDRMPVETLLEKKETIKANLNQAYHNNKKANKSVRDSWEQEKKEIDLFVLDFNNNEKLNRERVERIRTAMESLSADGFKGDEVEWFYSLAKGNLLPDIYAENLYPEEPIDLNDPEVSTDMQEGKKYYVKELPDSKPLDDIDAELLKANENNKDHEKYVMYLQSQRKKHCLVLELGMVNTKISKQKAERLDYIRKFEFPIEKLSVDEKGGLLLADKPVKPQYFSAGELIRIIPNLFAPQNPDFKYVFIQDFDLLDYEVQEKTVRELTEKGFQLLLELVGREKKIDKNCILLRNFHEVDEYPTQAMSAIDQNENEQTIVAELVEVSDTSNLLQQ